MTSANRLQLAYVEESTLGTTPASPDMTKIRTTGEGLVHDISNIQSQEIRADRKNSDLVQVSAQNTGPINAELSAEAFDALIAGAMFNDWTLMPTRDNDGTADSVITDVTAASDDYTFTTGAAFAEGHLVRASGFTNTENNGLFRAESGSGATSLVTADGRVDESAPPADAKLRVVGFEGESGDITATAGGLGSSTLDFTTLGLSVGQWIYIGGGAVGEQFATSALNTYAKISAIAANALTLSNKPAGWTTDAGASKTIRRQCKSIDQRSVQVW